MSIHWEKVTLVSLWEFLLDSSNWDSFDCRLQQVRFWLLIHHTTPLCKTQTVLLRDPVFLLRQPRNIELNEEDFFRDPLLCLLMFKLLKHVRNLMSSKRHYCTGQYDYRAVRTHQHELKRPLHVCHYSMPFTLIYTLYSLSSYFVKMAWKAQMTTAITAHHTHANTHVTHKTTLHIVNNLQSSQQNVIWVTLGINKVLHTGYTF